MTFNVIIRNLNNSLNNIFILLNSFNKKKCEICRIVLMEHDSFYIWLFYSKLIKGIGMQGL